MDSNIAINNIPLLIVCYCLYLLPMMKKEPLMRLFFMFAYKF
ncbi:hypothetical protein HMPREF0454_03816 [Hafnia alvei ATCC 51873]|uniref:Uncharacterized protein n=1 Tax=Hafnia alvei ATCC 51873 TaxID=1002364 RepID=G9YAY1_HAFAL|nr:hypothetical protein HMPREF0454_03816 [Hafnia alvei ATCC 51873]